MVIVVVVMVLNVLLSIGVAWDVKLPVHFSFNLPNNACVKMMMMMTSFLLHFKITFFTGSSRHRQFPT